MDCRNFQELISRHLDGALTKEEERLLFHHLESCQACVEVLGLFRRNREVLRTLPRTSPSPMVRTKVFAAWAKAEGHAWRDTTRLSRRSSRRGMQLRGTRHPVTMAYGASAVALVCLAILAGWQVWGTGRVGSPKQVSAFAAAPVAEEVPSGDDLTVPLGSLAARAVPAMSFPASPPLQAEDDMVVPAYLPSGIQLERLTLRNDRRSGRIVQVELIFRGDPGTVLRLSESRVDSGYLDPEILAGSGSVVIAGRGWLYGQRAGVDRRVLHILLGQRGSVMISLEGGLPLPELVKVVESFPSD